MNVLKKTKYIKSVATATKPFSVSRARDTFYNFVSSHGKLMSSIDIYRNARKVNTEICPIVSRFVAKSL